MIPANTPCEPGPTLRGRRDATRLDIAHSVIRGLEEENATGLRTNAPATEYAIVISGHQNQNISVASPRFFPYTWQGRL